MRAWCAPGFISGLSQSSLNDQSGDTLSLEDGSVPLCFAKVGSKAHVLFGLLDAGWPMFSLISMAFG
jgi:hypothetical protein